MKITVHNPFTIEALRDKEPEKVLIKGVKILEKLNLKYWLSAGTLLGLYRDKTFIPHDTDIDVEVELNSLININKIIELFSDEFKLIRSMYDEDGDIVQLAFMDDIQKIIFDIYFFKPEGDTLISKTDCGKLYYPKAPFEHLEDFLIFDKVFKVPEPSWYCGFRYGEDWNIPKTAKGNWAKDASNLEIK